MSTLSTPYGRLRRMSPNIHVAVAVDVWEFRNGRFVRTGVVTYHYSVKTYMYIDGIFGILMYYGEIERVRGLAIPKPIRFRSTPAQDITMMAMIEADLCDPPFYNALLYNCINYSVDALQYGMDLDDPAYYNSMLPKPGDTAQTKPDNQPQDPPPQKPKAP